MAIARNVVEIDAEPRIPPEANRAFYKGEAIAYEKALSILEVAFAAVQAENETLCERVEKLIEDRAALRAQAKVDRLVGVAFAALAIAIVAVVARWT